MHVLSMLRLLLSGALAMALLALASAPAHALLALRTSSGDIEIELLEAPVERANDPRAQVYIIDHLAPGSEIQRSVRVTNDTARAQTVRVYPGPAEIRDGGFVGLDPGARSELSTWTTVSEPTLELAAGTGAEVDVTIRVPEDASEAERYGVVWASVASEGQGSIRQVNRVGIRIYLSTGPGGEPASDFEIESLMPGRAEDGTPYVEATVTNSGGRAIDLRGNLRLNNGPGGLKAGPFDVSTGTLAPGDTEALLVELDESTPAGPWTARLLMRSGLLEKRANAEITFPEAGQGKAVDAEGETPWWQSWPFLVGLALLILLLALLFWLLRRRRRDDEGQNEVAPQPEVVATP